MTDHSAIERTAQTWIELGPTRAPEPAVAAALDRIAVTTQDRAFITWRSTRMTRAARLVAVAAMAALAIGGVSLLAGGIGDADPSPSPSVNASPTPGASEASPSSSAAATTTFTTTTEPRLAIDLPPEWLASESGSVIRMSYLGPGFETSNLWLIRLEASQVVETGGTPGPVPDDLLAWIAAHPGMSGATEGEVAIGGSNVPTVEVTGAQSGNTNVEHTLLVVADTDEGEIAVASFERWWFAELEDGAGGEVLVGISDPDDAAIERAAELLGSLRAAGG
jgi:hypothetical protein